MFIQEKKKKLIDIIELIDPYRLLEVTRQFYALIDNEDSLFMEVISQIRSILLAFNVSYENLLLKTQVKVKKDVNELFGFHIDLIYYPTIWTLELTEILYGKSEAEVEKIDRLKKVLIIFYLDNVV
jgi:hypothetical protein